MTNLPYINTDLPFMVFCNKDGPPSFYKHPIPAYPVGTVMLSPHNKWNIIRYNIGGIPYWVECPIENVPKEHLTYATLLGRKWN